MSHQRRRGAPARIWRTKPLTDRRGNVVVAAVDAPVDALDGPYDVRAAFIPQRSAKAEVAGQQQIDVIRMIVRPDLEDVNLWSRVEYNGHLWDVVTPPALHHGVRRHTEHWSIDLRRRP